VSDWISLRRPPGLNQYLTLQELLMSHPEYHNRNFRMNQLGPDRYTFLPPARRFSVQGLARLARPEEIASAALFLASDQSSYVAGIDLPVDGGLTAV
jgi:NAD(P)-dependent dehydrogenase (short-subunit alcohol dehydrogenase family)